MCFVDRVKLRLPRGGQARLQPLNDAGPKRHYLNLRIPLMVLCDEQAGYPLGGSGVSIDLWPQVAFVVRR